jgi:predicted NBD/HSP70 family sugar kinase
VKVTGTEAIAALADFSGAAIATSRIAVASHAVDAVVGTVVEALARLLGDAAVAPEDVAALCIAVSGDVDRERGFVRFSPFLGWSDVPLAALVEPALGIPTVIENDVAALTLAESATGAGVDVSPLAVVTIGAGVGCGIVVDGKHLTGSHGVAGELGHIPVGDPAVRCYCGGRGCVEAVASDTAIVDGVAEATGVPVATVAQAAELARAGDLAAAAVFARAAGAIGRALAVLANLIGPARILISGEGVASYDLLDEHVRAAFSEHAFGAARDCEIRLRPHSFEDWALGAGAVARDAFLAGRVRGREMGMERRSASIR